MKNLLLLVLLVSIVTSCNVLSKKIKGEGEVESEQRILDVYDKIEVKGNFNVHLIAGKMGKITVNAQKNLWPFIVTESKKNKLTIGIKSGTRLSSNDGLSVYVPIGNLKHLELSGSGSIISDNPLVSDNIEIELSGSGSITLDLRSNELECNLSGSGDINLSGKTDELEIELSGSGSVKAESFKAVNVEAEINGSGNIYVDASKSIKGRINGSGDVYYSGNPDDKDFKSSGSGNFKEK